MLPRTCFRGSPVRGEAVSLLIRSLWRNYRRLGASACVQSPRPIPPPVQAGHQGVRWWLGGAPPRPGYGHRRLEGGLLHLEMREKYTAHELSDRQVHAYVYETELSPGALAEVCHPALSSR